MCHKQDAINDLRRLYEEDKTYIDIFDILIVINAYKQVPDLAPYAVAIGDKAYRDMCINNQNQSIIISGESGAGKTESTKYVLQYLTESYAAGDALIKDRLIKSNLLLETFGNAKTIHNTNSSRFGQIIQVHFNNEHEIVGGHIDYYLFEKCRVCVQGKDENNYHIFYYLCVHAPEDIRNKLQLNSQHTFHYLNQDATQIKQLSEQSHHQDYKFELKRPNDKNDLMKYDQIMDYINISEEDKFNIYNSIAIILHLGNINFEDKPEDPQDQCEITSASEQALTITAKMLDVDVDDLQNALIKRILIIKKHVISIPLLADEAQNARDTLAKSIYAQLFNQIVKFINKSISFNSSKSYINILDTIGFEYYSVNSFEQFCMNYCNEKIQQLFNDYLFEKEKLLYVKEGFDLKNLDYTNNQDCIDLIEAQYTGCFYLLNEESKLAAPRSDHFTNEVYNRNKHHAKLSFPRRSKLQTARKIHDNQGFLIEHFSGPVVYSTTEFIEKNNDALPSSLVILIQKCKNNFLKKLFEKMLEYQQSTDEIDFISVGSKIRSQFIDLMNKLKKTNVHFIKCIKPNLHMKANLFEDDEILKQFQCNGITSILDLMCQVKSNILYPNKSLLIIQSHIRMYLQYKKYAPQIQSLVSVKIFYEQLNLIEKIFDEIGNRKKRKKYHDLIQELKQTIDQLINYIYNVSITTTTEIDNAYNNITLSLDQKLPRLKQVVFGRKIPELEEKFKKIEMEIECERKKREESERQLAICKYKKEELSEHPIVGRIYSFRTTSSIPSLFGIDPNVLCSPSKSKSQTTTSSTSSLSSGGKSKSNKGTKRLSVVLDITHNGINVLEICSFSGNDPMDTSNSGIFPMLTRTYLLKRLVPIHPTRTLPGRKSIALLSCSNSPDTSTYGYIILIPTFITNQKEWPKPQPEAVTLTDMSYIRSCLEEVARENNSIARNADDTDSTNSSVQMVRSLSLLEENDLNTHKKVKEWLNSVDNDDMISEYNISTSSSLDFLSIINDIDNKQFPSGDDETPSFLFKPELFIDYSNEFKSYEELIEAHSKNINKLDRIKSSLYIHRILHLINLLPLHIQCSIDNIDQIDLKAGESNIIIFDNKNTLTFIIDLYDTKWISEAVAIKFQGKENHNEDLILFHSVTYPNLQQILRMVLRVDIFHDSYYLSLYSPFWIVNRTELKLEFQIENDRTFIQLAQTPFLVCPEKFQSEANKKGQLRLYDIEQTDVTANWSDKFSLDIMKNTCMTSSTVSNDRTYMICVDILTCLFGLTKVITLSPSVVIINKLTVELEIAEIMSDEEQDKWIPINPEQIIPFWPHKTNDVSICVRYTDNRVTSTAFMINQRHSTFLHMDDEERPFIYVQVATTDFRAVKEISCHGGTAELVNREGQKNLAKQQAVNGLWIEYAWSVINGTLNIRINRVQIDNQHDYTIFPVVLYSIICPYEPLANFSSSRSTINKN